MNKAEQDKIVAEARSWLRTPYRVRGMVKGAGCDCGSFLMAVGIACGFIAPEQLEVYSVDCWAHWSDEKYLKRVMLHAIKVLDGVAYRSTKIEPGCFVLSQAVGCARFNHGGIVTRWPFLVHAVNPEVEETDATKHFLWAYKQIAVFELKGVR